MRVLALIIALLFSVAAQAQSIQQSGTVTPGHPSVWVGSGVQKDAGAATNGLITNLGLFANGGLPYCITASTISRANFNPASSPYTQLCLTATQGTTGGITLNSYNGAANDGFLININGTNYSFPASGSGTGNVTGPNSSTVGDLALFNAVNGQLLSDGGKLAAVSIVSQGADPTCAADSSAAFSTAAALGGNWYVPPGNYCLNNVEVDVNGTTFTGIANKSFLWKNGNHPVFIIGGSAASSTANGTGVGLQGLTIYGGYDPLGNTTATRPAGAIQSNSDTTADVQIGVAGAANRPVGVMLGTNAGLVIGYAGSKGVDHQDGEAGVVGYLDTIFNGQWGWSDTLSVLLGGTATDPDNWTFQQLLANNNGLSQSFATGGNVLLQTTGAQFSVLKSVNAYGDGIYLNSGADVISAGWSEDDGVQNSNITAWITGRVIVAGNWRQNAGNVYVATNSATTGASAPTCTSGTCSDGAVTWQYRGGVSVRAVSNGYDNNYVVLDTIGSPPVIFGVQNINYATNSTNSGQVLAWNQVSSVQRYLYQNQFGASTAYRLHEQPAIGGTAAQWQIAPEGAVASVFDYYLGTAAASANNNAIRFRSGPTTASADQPTGMCIDMVGCGKVVEVSGNIDLSSFDCSLADTIAFKGGSATYNINVEYGGFNCVAGKTVRLVDLDTSHSVNVTGQGYFTTPTTNTPVAMSTGFTLTSGAPQAILQLLDLTGSASSTPTWVRWQ